MIVLALVLSALPGTALAANPESGTTSTGQSLNIRIDTPTDGSTGAVGALVDVAGAAGIGSSSGGGIGALVIDLSGSTRGVAGDCSGDGSTDADDDFNGDGSNGTVLDCEIAGGLALLQSLSASGAQFGVVPFGSSGAVADVSPAAGDQDFAPVDADDNGDGTADLEEVLRSAQFSALQQFSILNVGGSTDFNDALTSLASLTSAIGDPVTVFFLSDGLAFYNGAPQVGGNVTINTYAVGTGTSCAGGLQQIAEDTGGTCTAVTDPTALSGSLGGATPAGIDRVEVRLNGGTYQPASIDALGNYDANDIGALVAGDNLVEARVTATDGTQVTADVTVTTTSKTAACDPSLTPSAAAAAGFNVIEGTGGRDTLNGTNGRDAIFARGANDIVYARGGDDCVLLGGGNDYVSGGPGNDVAFGQGGADKLDGNRGDDHLDGGPGAFSILVGGPGTDTCTSDGPAKKVGCDA